MENEVIEDNQITTMTDGEIKVIEQPKTVAVPMAFVKGALAALAQPVKAIIDTSLKDKRAKELVDDAVAAAKAKRERKNAKRLALRSA